MQRIEAKDIKLNIKKKKKSVELVLIFNITTTTTAKRKKLINFESFNLKFSH